MHRVHPRPRRGRTGCASFLLLGCVLLVLAEFPAAFAQLGGMGGFGNNYGGDRLVSQVTADGERVTLLVGNVWFRRDDVELRGDRARYYRTRDLIEIIGRVEVISDSVSLWCDSLRVFRGTDIAHAWRAVRIETVDGTKGQGQRGHYRRDIDWLALAGRARVIDGAYVIDADSISHHRTEGVMRAFGNVKIVDSENQSVVEGQRAVFDRKTGVAVVDSLPSLSSRSGNSAMTNVRAQWMSYDERTQSKTAIGGVDFRQGLTQARADTARFVSEDLLVLLGSPTVSQEGRVMEGGEIRFHYDEGELERIEVFGQASLVDSTPDTLARDFANIPLTNTLSGDTLRIHVVEGEIVRIRAKGKAKSIYLPDDQSAAISVNEVEGREIEIHFLDGLVQDVDVLGNVRGSYLYLERTTIAELRAASTDSSAADSTAVSDSTLANGGVAVADSLRTPIAVDGTALPDTLAEAAPADSLGALAALSEAEGDSVVVPPGMIDFRKAAQSVKYVGEGTHFQVPRGRIHIEGNAEVRYGTLELYAHDVFFDTQGRELLAEGDPRLVDRESEIVGERMGYLFEPRTGAVGDGATRFDDGFYFGQHIRRVDRTTLLVEEGIYTTCELEDPHYHFLAKKMKLKVGESVVARQVTFHLSDIPLIALPFYYKDLKKGRRSGILFPNLNLGVSSREGRYVRDLGYYWATNDYTDFKFEMDYNERRELTLTVDNVYTKRYSFDGNARFSYTRKFEEATEFGSNLVGDEWRFDARHTQPELFEHWRASTEVSLASSALTRNNPSDNTNVDLIDSRLFSRGSASRSFDNGSSLNLGLNRTQWVNAEDDDVFTNNALTNLGTTLGLSFKQGPVLGGRKRPTSPALANVLRDITFSQSYSSAFDRAVNENSRRESISARGNFSLSYAPDAIGPLRVTSRANFAERWSSVDERIDVYKNVTTVLPDSTEIIEAVIDQERSSDGRTTETIPSLNFSNSLSTKVYGLVETRLGPVRAIRHIIDLSASHNYTPELGSKQTKSQNIGLSMSQGFSLKIADSGQQMVRGEGAQGAESPADSLGTDGEPQEGTRKLDNLVQWNLSTSVDPDADPGARWRNISSSITVRPGITQAIDFSMNQTIDPYKFEVLSTNFNSSLRLRGVLDLGGALLVRKERENRILERLPDAEPDSLAIDPERDDLEPWEEDELARQERERFLEGGDRNSLPWDLYVRGSFAQNRLTGGGTTDRASLSTQANVGLPGQWKISYSADFDVEAGEFTNQFWRLSRRLHHWRLEFSRGLTDGQDFGFSLYLDAIPDLRVDRGDRARSSGVRDRLDSTF